MKNIPPGKLYPSTPDKFQPAAIVKKLEEMKRDIEFGVNGMNVEFLSGIKFALVWAKVEILEMAFAKDRFLEEKEEGEELK